MKRGESFGWSKRARDSYHGLANLSNELLHRAQDSFSERNGIGNEGCIQRPALLRSAQSTRNCSITATQEPRRRERVASTQAFAQRRHFCEAITGDLDSPKLEIPLDSPQKMGTVSCGA